MIEMPRHMPVRNAELRKALETLRNPAPGMQLVSHGFVSRYCTWTEDDLGVSQTTCGNSFALDSGSPGENGMKFCCYCGKELRAPDAQQPGE